MQLTDIDIPANIFFQYDGQTLAFTDFNPDLVAGRLYQFELTRIDPSTGTDLEGDWDLLELGIELT